MKETLKRIKADVILSALLCVALGVVLIIWSDETISAICMLLAFGLIVMGVVNLVGYFTNHRLTSFNGMLGLILVLVGIWLFARPEYIAMIFPIVSVLCWQSMGSAISKWLLRQRQTVMRSGGVQ